MRQTSETSAERHAHAASRPRTATRPERGGSRGYPASRRRRRAAQGFPERIEDPAAVAVLAAILRGTRQRAPPSESATNEGNAAA
jgi:hypothetical protein